MPVRFSATDDHGAPVPRPAASAGQHSAEVEREFGIDPVKGSK